MKILNLFSIISMLLVFSLHQSCKSKKGSTQRSNPEQLDPTADATADDTGNGEQTDGSSGQEDIGTDPDYDQFQNAISDYKESTEYKDPQTPEDQAFNNMVDKAAELTEKNIEDLVEDCKFSKMQENMDALVENDPLVDESAASEGDESKLTKTALLQGTGIYLAATAVLVTTMAAAGGAYVTAKAASENSSSVRKAAVAGGIMGAAVAGTAMLFPLVVGSMIVANDKPDETTISQAKAVLGLQAFGASAIGLGGLAVAWQFHRNPNWMNLGIKNKPVKQLGTPIMDSTSQSTLKKSTASIGEFSTKPRNIALAVGAAFLGVGIANAVLASQDYKEGTGLKLTETASPQATLLNKMEEFHEEKVNDEKLLCETTK